LLSKAQATQSQ